MGGGFLAIAAGIAVVVQTRSVSHGGRSAESWVEQLSSESETDRDEARRALRAMGTNAIPILVDRLKYQDSPVRSNVAELLRNNPVQPVELLHAGEYHKQAYRGLDAISEIGAPAIPELMKLLDRPDVAHLAAAALTTLDDSVIPSLLVASTNADPRVRIRVMHNLGSRRIWKDGVIEAIINGANDTNTDVRAAAVYALRNIPAADRQRIAPALGRLLRDEDPNVRRIALTQLADSPLEARPFVPSVVALLDDTDLSVRNAAARLLAEIGGEMPPGAVDKLIAIASTESPKMDPAGAEGAFIRVADLQALIFSARTAVWKIDPKAAERAGVVRPTPVVKVDYE